jgi:8-oxo-dGTP diphosphatase
MINVVGAVLIKENHIILARRSSSLKNFPNLFEFPGGKIEKDETHEQALKRELKEELDIDVEISDISTFKDNNSSHTIEKNGKIINLTLFIIKKWEGELKIKENIHSELCYIEIEHLDTFEDMIPGDAVFIPAIKMAL